MPVKRQTIKVRATDQWISREARLCRRISLPTTTSSRVCAVITATSRGRWGVVALIEVPLSRGRQIRVFGVRSHDFLPPELRVVAEGAEDRADDRDGSQRPEDVLPELHEDRDVRIRRKVVPVE